MNRADAVVVGGGPAGAGAAILLAKKGYDVCLLDRARFPREKTCGEFVNPAACDLIESVFGIDRAELIQCGGTPVDLVSLRFKELAFVDVPIVDAFGTQRSGVSIRRSILDDLLIKACISSNVRVLQGHNVRALKRTESGIVVSGESAEAAPFQLEAELVIAADGSNSRLARLERVVIPRRSSIGLSAHLEGDFASRRDNAVFMFPSYGNGITAGFAFQGDSAGVLSASIPTSHRQRLAADAKHFAHSLAVRYPSIAQALGSATTVTDISTTSCFEHDLTSSFSDRILFVGDAARFVDPFTGEGIHHAIEGAVIAARTASRALESRDASKNALSSYELGRAELSRRYTLCSLVQWICVRPLVMSYIGRRLCRKPAVAQSLIGVLVDLLPARRVLSAGFVIRAIGP